MQIIWVWFLPHSEKQEDRKVTLQSETNFSPGQRKHQQSSKAKESCSAGLLTVSNWRNVIHQPPGALAWLPGSKPPPQPPTPRLPFPSTQGSGSLFRALLPVCRWPCPRGRPHDVEGHISEPQLTIHISLTAKVRTNPHSSPHCPAGSTSPGAPRKRGECSGPRVPWYPI